MTRWPTKPLGDLAKFVNGRAFKPSDWSATGRPIIRIQNLTDPTATAHRFDGVVDKRNEVKDGDLLVSWSATLDVFTWERGDAVLNQHIFRVDPDLSQISKGYLFYALKSVMDELRSKTHGATMQHITKEPFEQTRIPLPPLAEQERIVRILDEAEEMKRLRGQANKRTADIIPALFHEMFGSPADVATMKWAKKKLGAFGDVTYGLADKLDNDTAPDAGTRILTISNVRLDGTIDTTMEKYSVAPDNQKQKARLRKHDLLFNWRNGSEVHVGKTAIWEEQIAGDVLHVSFLLKIRLSEEANPYFYWSLLNLMRASGFFVRNARMQINRKFNASELSDLDLPIPPIELQNEYAARIHQIRSLIGLQRDVNNKSEDLFQSLLHSAFEGEL